MINVRSRRIVAGMGKIALRPIQLIARRKLLSLLHYGMHSQAFDTPPLFPSEHWPDSGRYSGDACRMAAEEDLGDALTRLRRRCHRAGPPE